MRIMLASVLIIYIQFYISRASARVSEKQLSWSEVQELVNRNSIDKLGRSVAMEEKYQMFRSSVASQWFSLADYILVTKFHAESRVKDGKIFALPLLQQSSRELLIKNDYPYNFEPHIEHYILWKIDSLSSSPLTLSDVTRFMQSHAQKCVQDYIAFITPIALMSIPELQHAHVLMRINDVNETCIAF